MTCDWFDKTSEENIGFTKRPKKAIKDNKIDINKNIILCCVYCPHGLPYDITLFWKK
jgi:hypothetical protein